MADNNSSGFNFRVIADTNKLSLHSFGRAVDINPVQNPVIYPAGIIAPAGATLPSAKQRHVYSQSSYCAGIYQTRLALGRQF
ncbi:MAG: M15 family metallopeptidase [Desulfobacterales bacterium]|nr:M15 family metallopeptidase [Desulfobacterales bacterium]